MSLLIIQSTLKQFVKEQILDDTSCGEIITNMVKNTFLCENLWLRHVKYKKWKTWRKYNIISSVMVLWLAFVLHSKKILGSL